MNHKLATETEEGKEMMRLVTYEMVRHLDEERRARSMKRFWWRHAQLATETVMPTVTPDADVIELVFGARCDAAEEPIGA
jgi:hypothetical protein